MKKLVVMATVAVACVLGSSDAARADHDSPRVRFHFSFGNGSVGFGNYRPSYSSFRSRSYRYPSYRIDRYPSRTYRSGGYLIRHGCHYDYVPSGHFGVPVYSFGHHHH